MAVNRFFGEATVEAAGKSYKLRLDINAMCCFEDVTGKEAMAVLEALERGKASTKDLRAMLWCCLQGHHPEATIEDAGEIMSQNLEALTSVLQNAMPPEEEISRLGATTKGKRKRPARRG